MNIITLDAVEATAFQIVLEPQVQDYYTGCEYGGGTCDPMEELIGFNHEDLTVVSIVLSDEAKDILVDMVREKIQELAQLEATSPILYTLAYKLAV